MTNLALLDVILYESHCPMEEVVVLEAVAMKAEGDLEEENQVVRVANASGIHCCDINQKYQIQSNLLLKKIKVCSLSVETLQRNFYV